MDFALKTNLAERRTVRRRLTHGELFCLSCKAVKTPALGLVDYAPLSTSHGQVRGVCVTCEGTCTRIIRGDDFPRWRALNIE